MQLARDRVAGTLTLTNPTLCEKIGRTAAVFKREAKTVAHELYSFDQTYALDYPGSS